MTLLTKAFFVILVSPFGGLVRAVATRLCSESCSFGSRRSRMSDQPGWHVRRTTLIWAKVRTVVVLLLQQ